jgi:cell division protein FtsI (penicillin-binding protein 3)
MSLIDLGRRILPRPSARGLAEWIQSLEHAFEKARADGRIENDTRFRMKMVAGVFSLIFLALMMGAARAALFSGLSGPTAGSGVDVVQRGDLTDRNGLLMATNLPHYRLVIEPTETVDAAFVQERILSALPEMPRTSRRRLARILAGEERGFIMGGLTAEDRQRVHALALGGVYFEEEDARVYPLNDLGAHVIGFANQEGDGAAGFEAAFNQQIREAGQTGGSVALSIDLRVQGALENELEAVAVDQQVIGAVGIVTNIRTGEVLAMASYPDFDPNHRGQSESSAFINRAAGQVWEMGSTFKIFSVAAGLDSGTVRPDSIVDAAGGLRLGSRVINDFHGVNRAMTVEEVFTHSSNIGTSRIAAMMGGDVMQSYYDEFGLLDRMQIGLAESTAPLIPRRWDANTIASASFGHAMAVTPLQVAAGVGAIMNGGEYVPLTLRPVRDRSLLQPRRVVSPQTSLQMLRLMRLNVTNGSGRRADIEGFSVGGKTGTAEKYTNGRPDRTRVVSSFVSVFPTEGPLTQDRYLVLILLDEPRGSAQSGGARTAGFTAAPAVGRVIRRIGPFLGVRRQRTGELTAEHLQPLSEDGSVVGEPQ